VIPTDNFVGPEAADSAKSAEFGPKLRGTDFGFWFPVASLFTVALVLQ
jgi:hypothetical protein